MFEGFVTKVKESLGIWPAYSPRNKGVDAGEMVSGNRDIHYQRLEATLKKISERYKASGVTVAVVKNSAVEWTTSFGYADKEKGIAAKADTAYRIASVSKTAASMMVMTLWDKGIIELDKDISSYLGFTVRNPYHPDIPVTLKNLLSHTSSISDIGTYLKAVEAGTGFPALEDMLTPGRPAYDPKNFYKYEPGSPNFNYSNFGYGIIAAIVESVTGKRFSDYAREALFEPLNLDASFLPNYIKDQDRVASIYRNGSLSFSRENAFKGEERISKFPVGRLYLLAQGNLYISAVDLAKLMIVLMEGGICEGKRILSKEAVDMMSEVHFSRNNGFIRMYGLGLEITDRLVAGRRLRGHQGRAYGATNEMFCDIADKTGVVFLSNGSKDKKDFNGYAAIGSGIVNAVYDEMR